MAWKKTNPLTIRQFSPCTECRRYVNMYWYVAVHQISPSEIENLRLNGYAQHSNANMWKRWKKSYLWKKVLGIFVDREADRLSEVNYVHDDRDCLCVLSPGYTNSPISQVLPWLLTRKDHFTCHYYCCLSTHSDKAGPDDNQTTGESSFSYSWRNAWVNIWSSYPRPRGWWLSRRVHSWSCGLQNQHLGIEKGIWLSDLHPSWGPVHHEQDRLNGKIFYGPGGRHG